MGADTGITAGTVDAWVSALEASHVIFFLRPYHRNFGKRLTKSPKLYFCDPALAARLLGLVTAIQVRDNPLWGALFENLVISDIRKGQVNRGLPPSLWFWRDHRGTELDLVIEQGGVVQAVEIKAGQTIAADWFGVLSQWQAWVGPGASPPAVVYGGSESTSWQGWCRVLPWTRFGDDTH